MIFIQNRLTNMHVPGQWLFRIGLIDLDIPIEEPDTNNDGNYSQHVVCHFLHVPVSFKLVS